MKALKEFDYNLWTTEENGVKNTLLESRQPVR